MLRFLRLGMSMRVCEADAIRQPPPLLMRYLSGSSSLDQARSGSSGGKKGSKEFKVGKSGGAGLGGRKNGSSSGKSVFRNKKRSSSVDGSKVDSSVCYDKNSSRFTMDLGNNLMARIDYRPIGHNKIDLYYTEVPSELRGRGIGKALAKGALEQAAKNKMKVKLSCSYLANNLDKFANAKLKKIVEK